MDDDALPQSFDAGGFDLGRLVEQRNTPVRRMPEWAHGYGRAVDSQGSRCGGEGSGKAVATMGAVRLRKVHTVYRHMLARSEELRTGLGSRCSWVGSMGLIGEHAGGGFWGEEAGVLNVTAI